MLLLTLLFISWMWFSHDNFSFIITPRNCVWMTLSIHRLSIFEVMSQLNFLFANIMKLYTLLHIKGKFIQFKPLANIMENQIGPNLKRVDVFCHTSTYLYHQQTLTAELHYSH